MKILSTLITLCILQVSCHTALASDVFEDLYDHLHYLAERDKVLSQNIANADTPAYIAQDLKKKRSSTDGISMARTNSMHMDVSSVGGNFSMFTPKVDEVKPNGNAVNIERELFKKNENSQKLIEATNVYNKSKSMMNTAIVGTNR